MTCVMSRDHWAACLLGWHALRFPKVFWELLKGVKVGYS